MWFEDKAEEAMNFYVSLFKDARIVSIAKYPEGAEGPMKGMSGKVLTGVFQLAGQQFMALDGGPVFKPSGAISFFVECEDQAEVDTLWGALSANPQTEQCGWLQDKYGFTWQIIPKALPKLLTDPDRTKANRAMRAMMTMKKIVIADLQKAFDG